MRSTSRRTLWLLLAGAVLTGWCSASIVSPPAAGTQMLPTSPGRGTSDLTMPSVALAPAVPRTPPTSVRNPFAFGALRTDGPATPPAGTTRPDDWRVDVPGRDSPTPDAGGDPVESGWRLIGIATAAGGHTAVLAGPGGVQLARVGDRLADGRTVLALTDAAVTLGLDDGRPIVLRLP